MSHRASGQYSIPLCLSDDRHAAFIHASNCITLRTGLVHMVEIFKFTNGTSWKSRKRSWMRKGEKVELYFPKTREMIYMPECAGQMHRDVIGPHHPSLRKRG